MTGHRDVVHQNRSGFTSDSCGRVGTKGAGICTCDRWPHIVNFVMATYILYTMDIVNVVLYFVIDVCCNYGPLFV